MAPPFSFKIAGQAPRQPATPTATAPPPAPVEASSARNPDGLPAAQAARRHPRGSADLGPRHRLALTVRGAHGPEPLEISLGAPLEIAGGAALPGSAAPDDADPSPRDLVNYAIACLVDHRAEPGETLARSGDAALHRFAASSPDYRATGAEGAELEVLIHETNTSIASIQVRSELESAEVAFRPLDTAVNTAQIRLRYPRRDGEGVCAYADRLQALNAAGRARIAGRGLTRDELLRVADAPLPARRSTDDLALLAGLYPRLAHEPRAVYVRRLWQAAIDGRLRVGGAMPTLANIVTASGLRHPNLSNDPSCEPLPPRLAAIAQRFPLLPHTTPAQQLDEIVAYTVGEEYRAGGEPLDVNDMVRITGLQVATVRRALRQARPHETVPVATGRVHATLSLTLENGSLATRRLGFGTLLDPAEPEARELFESAIAALVSARGLGQAAGGLRGAEVIDTTASSDLYVEQQMAAIVRGDDWSPEPQYRLRLWTSEDQVTRIDLQSRDRRLSGNFSTPSSVSEPPRLEPDELAAAGPAQRLARLRKPYDRRNDNLNRVIALKKQLPVIAGETPLDHALRLRAAASDGLLTPCSWLDIALATRLPLIGLVPPGEVDALGPTLARAIRTERDPPDASACDHRRRLFKDSTESGTPLSAHELSALTGETVKQIVADPLCSVVPADLQAIWRRFPRGDASRASYARRLKILNDDGQVFEDGRRLTFDELALVSGTKVNHLLKYPEFKAETARQAKPAAAL